jgi:PEP-CTERM motif-containing protein
MPTKIDRPQPGSKSQEILSPQLQRRLDRHFVTCSATLGASLAVVAAGSHEAKADIRYSGTQNVQIPADDILGIYFDFDTNSFSKVGEGSMPGSDANLFDAYVIPDINGNFAYHAVSFYGPNRALNTALATLTSAAGETLRLDAGFTVGPNPSMGVFGHQNDLANQFYNYPAGTTYGPLTGQWASGGTGFLGFRFVDANGQTDYGWMRVTFDPANFLNRMPSTIVVDWAFDDSGNPIETGAIPEPSSVALAFLGAGAVGLALWRQRRSQRQRQ